MPLLNTSARFTDYYNRIVENDGVEAIMFRAGKALQSAELNELQSIMLRRIDSVADAVFKNGDVIEAAEIFIVEGNVNANIELKAGRIYVLGSVYSLAGAQMLIPFTAKVQVGLRVRFLEIDETDDPSLLDPAVRARNFGEGGAGRKTIEMHWGWRADDDTEDARSSWDFYPIYEVDHGVIVIKKGIGIADPVLDLVARYDRESNGNYVVRGLRPTYVLSVGSNYIFDVTEGVADIFGYKVDRLNGTRLTWGKDYDAATSNNEPHTYAEDDDNKFRLRVNRFPIASVGEIIGTKRKTVTVTRGAFAGGSDQMPDSTVALIVQVSQGATVYVEGRDYTVSGDTINWAPSGAGAIEPAGGSSYTVIYNYTTTLTPLETHDDYLVFSGCVEGTLIYIDYNYKLPRVDVIAMKRDGTLIRVKGISQVRNPSPPKVSPNEIEIGQVFFDWMNDPVVTHTAIRAIPMSEIEDMRQSIDDLFQLVALERLKTNVASTDPTTKLGVFVDAFFDDDMRDQGIDQTAAIYGGVLMLSNVPTAIEPSNSVDLKKAWLLPFNKEVILQQNSRSSCMKINPYQSFDILPSVVTLNPASDRWVEWNYKWLSPVSLTFYTGLTDGWLSTVTTSVQTRVVHVSFAAAQFIRQRAVGVTVQGFLPNEAVNLCTFDGINVTPVGVAANSSGTVSTSFNIPANVLTGTREFRIQGAGGSWGRTSYFAAGIIATEVLRRVIVTTVNKYDPLAQTFTLPISRMVAAVDIWFCAKGGQNDVRVQLRETQVGLPTQDILTEAIIPHSSIITNQWTRAEFPIPVPVLQDREYAIVVLTDDAAHSISVAQLGQQAQRDDGSWLWMTSQPYTVGTLLSSSNASTWTPHQDMDMMFRLVGCRFTANTRTVDFGVVDADDNTDMLVNASVERTSADTDVVFGLKPVSSGVEATANEGAAIPLSTPVSGDVEVRAYLKGSELWSPILYPDWLVMLGNLAAVSDYISRAIKAALTFQATVIFEAYQPGSSTVVPTMEFGTTASGVDAFDGDGNPITNWAAMTLVSSTDLGNGWRERKFTVSGLRGASLDRYTRCKLVLTGSAANRPLVRNLQVIVK